MPAWIWPSLRRQPRLPQMCWRCGGDGDVLAEQSARPWRRSGRLCRLVDVDPVSCVVPGRGGNRRMGFGWVRHVRWVAAVGGVDVGVESERFVGIALQGSDAVVMRA